MKDFAGRIAVVTGGGTGMGRELTRQLVAEGCHVATCDIIKENLTETLELCKAEAPRGVVVTAHPCDVADEEQVLAFRDEVQDQHQTSHINLLFNNAGIGGGGSFIESSREEWERTFNICWNGVYYFARAFMPLLLESSEVRRQGILRSADQRLQIQCPPSQGIRGHARARGIRDRDQYGANTRAQATERLV